MAKSRILKLKDSIGTIAYFDDHRSYPFLANETSMRKYKTELENKRFTKVYLGVYKNPHPKVDQELFDVFVKQKPDLSWSSKSVFVGYAEDPKGEIVFDKLFQLDPNIAQDLFEKQKEKDSKSIIKKITRSKTADVVTDGFDLIKNIIYILLITILVVASLMNSRFNL
tara:strand:+ start:554 stop:1057 length:504 start_codon:yes stop_codon:yes gene_type:complete